MSPFFIFQVSPAVYTDFGKFEARARPNPTPITYLESCIEFSLPWPSRSPLCLAWARKCITSIGTGTIPCSGSTTRITSWTWTRAICLGNTTKLTSSARPQNRAPSFPRVMWSTVWPKMNTRVVVSPIPSPELWPFAIGLIGSCTSPSLSDRSRPLQEAWNSILVKITTSSPRPHVRTFIVEWVEGVPPIIWRWSSRFTTIVPRICLKCLKIQFWLPMRSWHLPRHQTLSKRPPRPRPCDPPKWCSTPMHPNIEANTFTTIIHVIWLNWRTRSRRRRWILALLPRMRCGRMKPCGTPRPLLRPLQPLWVFQSAIWWHCSLHYHSFYGDITRRWSFQDIFPPLRSSHETASNPLREREEIVQLS